LYKYAQPDRLDVLRGGRIRFTPAIGLNDPFELRPYFEALLSFSELREMLGDGPIDITDNMIALYEETPQIQQLLSLDSFLDLVRSVAQSPDGQELMGAFLHMVPCLLNETTGDARAKLQELFRTRVGILSLSEAPDHHLMWSHYADNHRGFVLGLDESHSFFDQRRSPADEFYHLRKVVYRMPIAHETLMRLDGTDVFLVKRPEWSYEREWRMLVPLEAADLVADTTAGQVHLFNLPPSAVTEVILGAMASDAFVSSVQELLSQSEHYDHVYVGRAELDDRAGDIRIMRVTGQT